MASSSLAMIGETVDIMVGMSSAAMSKIEERSSPRVSPISITPASLMRRPAGTTPERKAARWRRWRSI